MLELNKIYNIDCMTGMKEFPDNYFELAIVDPPYGIGDFNQSDAKQGKVLWNENIPSKDYFIELQRVSKNQIIWGANYYHKYIKTGGRLIWHKGPSHPAYSECEIASVSFQKKVDYVRINWQSGFYRKRIENIIHHCQKPVALYGWLLNNYAKPGDKILDTHLGSASSVIACIELGFEYIGFEIDKEYFENAQKRINQFKAQADLFRRAV